MFRALGLGFRVEGLSPLGGVSGFHRLSLGLEFRAWGWGGFGLHSLSSWRFTKIGTPNIFPKRIPL